MMSVFPIGGRSIFTANPATASFWYGSLYAGTWFLLTDALSPGAEGHLHWPAAVSVTFTPRKYLGPVSPMIVYVKTGSRVRASGPPSGTSVEKPVVPAPPGPTPEIPGWLSRCWS